LAASARRRRRSRSPRIHESTSSKWSSGTRARFAALMKTGSATSPDGSRGWRSSRSSSTARFARPPLPQVDGPVDRSGDRRGRCGAADRAHHLAPPEEWAA
jgi:hypothetical protein